MDKILPTSWVGKFMRKIHLMKLKIQQESFRWGLQRIRWLTWMITSSFYLPKHFLLVNYFQSISKSDEKPSLIFFLSFLLCFSFSLPFPRQWQPSLIHKSIFTFNLTNWCYALFLSCDRPHDKTIEKKTSKWKLNVPSLITLNSYMHITKIVIHVVNDTM